MGQTHIGVWLTTRHSALTPQDPRQGSLHFWFMQAKSLGHSLLLTHSGLQLGGMPMNSDEQEQEGELLTTLHWELGPHGEGSHGFCGIIGSGAKSILWIIFLLKENFCGKLKKQILRCRIHRMKGSPVNPGKQLHMGLWLITLQIVLNPQEPGQGFTHFWLLQASDKEQSELTVHSGRQAGGAPRYPATQEHTGCWLISRQTLFGPQGEGEQGFLGMVSVTIW